MTVLAYTGLDGSGKSYNAVEHIILPALKAGKRVWTNIPMNLDTLKHAGYSLPVIFNTQEILDNPKWFQEVFDPGATIVIDEAWRIWKAGVKSNMMEEGHKEFFAEHRHMVGEDGHSTDIVLVTQNMSQLASFVRDMVKFTYRHTKMLAVGQNKRFRVDIYEGSVTGTKPPKSQLLREMFGKYDQSVYRFYKSQTKNKGVAHGSEELTDKRMNVLNSAMLRFGIPAFVIVAAIWSYVALTSAYTNYQSDDTEAEVVQSSQPGTPTPTVRRRPQTPDPLISHLFENADIVISYNNGVFPFIDYVFTITGNGYQSSVSFHQLRTLGVDIKPISQCLVLLMNRTDVYRAQCALNVDEPRQEHIDPIGDFNLTSG